jgi:Flp pilus assembly protein TadG
VKRAPGQAIVWVAVLLPVLFLPIVGVSIDAGLLFDTRRDAQNVADGAARVGAMELRQDALLEGQARIDRDAARRQARAYARRSGFDVRGEPTFSSDDRTMSVTVQTTVRPAFLRMVRLAGVDVRATGRARACQGIEAERACN